MFLSYIFGPRYLVGLSEEGDSDKSLTMSNILTFSFPIKISSELTKLLAVVIYTELKERLFNGCEFGFGFGLELPKQGCYLELTMSHPKSYFVLELA